MNNVSIVFKAPYKVSVTEEPFSEEPGPGRLLVKKLYSLISTGTELACLSGGEEWFKMPGVPGYCCVSKIVEAGGGTSHKKGDRIFHYGSHCLYQVISTEDFLVPVPEGMDAMLMPVLRMATIALTAIRVSDIELGDCVAVSGLGLVGNMAAQLAALSGAVVIGTDPVLRRRELAKGCGIEHVLDAAGAAGEIKKITGGTGVHTVVEATGLPQVACELLPAIGHHGEIIFLGTPRGDYNANLAEILRYSHLENLGCITFKGAHEWRYPVMKNKFVKHSIRRNTEICMDLIKKRKLRVKELITHVIEPEKAPGIYLGINSDRGACMGVIIDWTQK